MDVQKNINFKKKNSKNESLTFDYIIRYLEPSITEKLYNIPTEIKKKIEEIRLRNNMPLMISIAGKDYILSTNGDITHNIDEGYIVTKGDIDKSFQILSNYSVYALEDEIRNGFITIKGGHRIGITGKVNYINNRIETIKNISSLNIRIAKEVKGVSDEIFKYLIKKPNSIYHTLIVSPPQCGKTTLLRDLVRNISNGLTVYDFKGLKVGLVDERSEIASVYGGETQNDVGIRTDVLDGCKKYDGIIMLIRAMSPNVIATDELGDKKDIDAIHEALKAGVKIISTVHGKNIDDIRTKPNLRKIISEKIFERIIIMDNSNGVGTIRDIVEGHNFKSILKEERKNYVSIKNNRKYNNNNFI
ncbi:stage III sporulation protein AA [Dethiothermospora halolimnae]|uniref:stage III sporulation protein AA n=1 Tax=Dethiothermospora halolimnae TaxID=3114390 RepID=UPI003CCB8765